MTAASTLDICRALPRLMNGRVGALLNETLRLYTVLPFIPKTNDAAQVLLVEGTECRLVEGTLSMINTSAVHRNPGYWPLPSKKRVETIMAA
jgi:cytochrome P450